MWKGYYGNEPFDAKLAVLRLIANLNRIIAVTVLGTLLFGGGYYVKNILLQGEKKFQAVSVYKLDYADTGWAANGSYINEATWNTWINTKEMEDAIKKYLDADGMQAEVQLQAKVGSDLRVPSTEVISSSREYSLIYAKALEKAMVNDFPGLNPKDVTAIRVIDPAAEATEVHPDVRPVRAFILSGILTLFFAVTIFLLKEWGEDSIRIPAVLYRRYGLRTLDTIQKQGTLADLDFFFDGKKRVAVCAVEDNTDADRVCEYLRDLEKEGKEEKDAHEWIAFPAVLSDRTVCEKIKALDGILLVVKSGGHAGKPLEYVLQILDEHECGITCALLWGADEKLIRNYYRFGGQK